MQPVCSPSVRPPIVLRWLPSTSLSPPDPPCPGRPLSTAHPHTRTLGHTPDGTSAPRHHSRRAAPGHQHNHHHHHHHHQRCTNVVRLPATTTAICNTKYLPGCAPYHTIPRLASPASPRTPDLPPSPFLPSTSRDPAPSRRGLASQHPSPRPQAFPDARRLRPPQHRPPCLVTSPTNPVVLSARCFPSRREPDRHLQHTHISTTVQHPPSRSSAETHLFAPSSSATTTVSSPPDRHARLLSHDDAAQQVGFRSSAAPDPLRPQPGPAALEAPPHQRRVRLPMLPYRPMTCPSAPLTCVLRRKSLGRWAVKLTDSLADA